MIKELRLFFTALMFYTRIPVPRSTGYSPENLNKATRYFPLIGAVVGGVGALVFWGTDMVLPVKVAVLLSMVTQIMVTGAFHEDAIADFCDGFGGGYTKERILSIMKDSRIGTYGAVGLVMILLTRFFLLSEFNVVFIPVALVVAHVVSRLVPVLLIFSSKYVSDFDKSKSKPIGQKSSKVTLIVALLLGLLPLVLVSPVKIFFITLFLIPLFFYFRYYVHKHIGGYTGDVLGALQQLSEISVYIALLIA